MLNESAAGPAADGRRSLQVWIDQDLCTGDGLCVQYERDVFEFDVDGLAYVKGGDGELLTSPGARTAVPESSIRDVLDATRECPGNCIHVVDAAGVEVAGPEAVRSK
jgi:ferredoxin